MTSPLSENLGAKVHLCGLLLPLHLCDLCVLCVIPLLSSLCNIVQVFFHFSSNVFVSLCGIFLLPLRILCILCVSVRCIAFQRISSFSAIVSSMKAFILLPFSFAKWLTILVAAGTGAYSSSIGV